MAYSQSEKHSLVIDDTKNRRAIELRSETYSIGRDPNNSIVLDSVKISRYHATLLRIAMSGTNGYRFRIIDGSLQGKRSRNGIEVNTVKAFSHDLQDGDMIDFGDGITATYLVTVDTSHAEQASSIFFAEEIEDEYVTRFTNELDSQTMQRQPNQTLSLSAEERKASIQQSLERLASFPELFSNPIVEINLQGKITYLNPAALKKFPRLQKEKLKHPILTDIISLIKNASKEHIVREIKIGREIFEQSIHIVSANQLVRCYVSDITKRKQAEIILKQAHSKLEQRVHQRTMELAHNNEILKAEIKEREQIEQEIRLLQTITQAITEAPSFDDAIAITLKKVCETVNWCYGEAWIPHEQEEVLKLSPAWYCSSQQFDKFRDFSQKFDFPLNVGKPGRVWATKQPEWTQDISLEQSETFFRSTHARATGLRTALGVPIMSGKKVIAVFVFFDQSALPENSQIVELVNSVAAQLGLVMEQKRADDALRSSMATNKAMFNAIPDLIFRISRSGTFVNFKAAKRKNLLFPSKDLVGMHVSEIYPEDIATPFLKCIRQAFATRELQVFECQILAEEEIHSYEIRIANSDIDEVMAIVRDITERKRAEEDIRRTLEQEKRLAELKNRFVTMASHEFRTPLASILSSAELLEHYSHKWSEEKQHTHLHRIQSSVKHMTGLLNDVLLLGKADAGKLALNPTKINLFNYCRELVEEIDLTNQTHRIVFQSRNCCQSETQGAQEVNNDCHLVSLDEKMLRHILSNLLSNAIKYSPKSDRVDFNFVCQSDRAIFRVRDYGIGIPPEDQVRLFESFHRAKNAGSIPGTGLGLAIVKRSVDLHQGKIKVDSRIGEGTIFTVMLPYLKTD